MSGEFLWITEADVVAAIDMAGAIAALENGLRAEARGTGHNLDKTHVAWKGGTLHAIGAVFPSEGFAGTHTWAREELGLEVREAASIEDAVREAPIVTTVTRATEPFLPAAWVARSAHVNAVGAIVPAGAEVAADLVARCGRVVVDSLPQARRLS